MYIKCIGSSRREWKQTAGCWTMTTGREGGEDMQLRRDSYLWDVCDRHPPCLLFRHLFVDFFLKKMISLFFV